jgi:sarcosine oxidase subunit alpha
MLNYDIVVIGGGAAGLLAAIAAKEEAAKSVLILDREEQLGGILSQYIHTGFEYDGEKDLAGPEYIEKLVHKVKELNIDYMVNSLAMDLNNDNLVTVVSDKGLIEIQAMAVILATGRRERPKGTANILGSKAAGIFTAATAQRLVTLEGYMPGKQVVIVGTSELSVGMARRLILEGANVKAVIEPTGAIKVSEKMIEECLTDFNIPLKLSYSITDIIGKERIKGVTIAEVDDNKIPVAGTEEYIVCDTLILSVTMFPEYELLKKVGANVSYPTNAPEVNEDMQTSIEGIYACGSVLNISSSLKEIILESYTAGKSAAKFVREHI